MAAKVVPRSHEFSKIGPSYWDDKPTVIVGQGISLKDFDLERLNNGAYHVLAVKGQMFNLPWADAGTGIDTPRLKEWRVMLHTVTTFPVYWAIPNFKAIEGGIDPWAPCMRFLRRLDTSALSDDPSAICCGGTSGFGALNVAYLKRAKRIILLGYDYDGDASGMYDSRAYIEDRPQDESRWRTWAKCYDQIKRQIDVSGIRIINASPKSRIPTFEKMDIDTALKEIVK